MTDTAEAARPVPRWLHVGAVLAVAIVLFPLVLGQIVTSIRAGMADPLWPTEPWYLVNNYKFDLGYLVEHSHRIAGFCVGGVISLLTVGIWWTEPRKSARWAGVVAVVVLLVGFGELHRAVMLKPAEGSNAPAAADTRLTVPPVPLAIMGVALSTLLGLAASGFARGVRGCGLRLLGTVTLVAVMIQGLLGGLRVKLDALVGPEMATIHGIFAQVVFGLLVSFAVLTARSPVAQVSRTVARWSVALALLMFVQVALGALVRHGPTPLTQRLHYLTAFLATAAAVWVLTSILRDASARARVRFAAWALGGLLVTQLVLGVEAWMAKFGAYTLPELVPITGWNAAIRTAHALVGTLVLATTVGIAVRLVQRVTNPVPPTETAEAVWQERTPATLAATLTTRFRGETP